MTIESDNAGHQGAGGRVGRFMLRFLIAVVISPVVFCLGVWLSIYATGIKPNSVLAASQPLLLLFLCPVYFAIAVVSYAFRSRAMFIVSSVSVAALAPASRSHVRMTRDAQNIDVSAQNAMIFGFIIAAACCTLIAIVNHFRGGGHQQSGNLLD